MNNKANKQPIRSVFHDCGYLYVSTIEPDIDEPITIRLRGEKGNITKAYVEISHEGTQWTSYELQLEEDDPTGYYEYFIGTIPGQKEMFKYRFRVGNEDPDNEVYYSRTRIGKDAPTFDETCMQPDDCWTMIPGFHTPDWAKGIIWYSVMPDAYYNGDLTNDKPVSGKNFSNSWNMAQHTLSYKYGGDLKGIEKKLDYIKSLGCEAVFMNPIFCSHQNAGYGPQYYKQIEGSVGNKQALIDLSKAIHDRDMRYMIDVVFALVTPSHYWYNRDKIYPNKGAAQEWDSPYHEFFYFTGEEGDTSKYLSSWSGLRLNMASEKLRDLLYRDKDSYLQYYCREPFFVDGVRFDCGGELGGEFSDGTKLVDSDVLGEIRPILRDINPEILLLSEYSMYYSVDKGVWDSRWNLEFVKYGLQYMRGEFPESRMYERIVNEINNVPRAFGHCIYNSMADHDRPRVTGVQPYAFRAFQLIHMTQIGSPCIFYGDENRIERETYNFYAMEWNEANWDYAVLNDTKALTELRKTYSALRTGIIQYLSVDDDERILAYARKDAEGTVITVASRNEAAKEFTIHVRELGEVDGTVFTDWFSGKQYEARNGYIEVLLPAGGTVFVKGAKSASHKGGFAIAGLHVDTSSVTMPKEHAFAIKEQGIFVHTDVFNTCEISALCRMQNGKGMLKIAAETEKDSAWIGAEVSEDTVAIYVQTAGNQEPCKVAETFIEENTYVKIVRDAKNYYSVYTTRTPGWKWNEVARGVHVDIPNHAKAGMLSMCGEAVFENVRVKYDKNSILFDDFHDGHSAMFDFDETMKIAYTTEGMKMQDAEIVTNAYDEDWTFRTEVLLEDSQPNDYAGIVCRQDKEIAVVTGRMNNEGVPVFFLGKYSAGKLVVVHIVEDFHPEQKAIVQLQRIGTAYSAVYSYDGSDFSMIGRNIIANMCDERVGLVVQGSGMGQFSYTYMYSANVHFSEDSSDYGSIRLILGYGLNQNGVKRQIEVCVRPKLKQAVLFERGWDPNEENANRAEKAVAVKGGFSELSIGKTFRYTVKYENGKVSFWLDGNRVFDQVMVDLDSITLQAGFYSQNCKGTISDIQIWGDVNAKEIPQFHEGQDINHMKDVVVSNPLTGNAEKLQNCAISSTATNTARMTLYGIQYGDSYCFSTTAHMLDNKNLNGSAEINWEGLQRKDIQILNQILVLVEKCVVFRSKT